MTDLAAPVPGIDPDALQYNARLVRREDETDSLAYFWVRFDGEPTPFEPGQYMTIGVMVDGKIVQRPYSVASPPVEAGTEGYEFYVRLVEGGTFTPLLWEMPVGQKMRMIGPKGKFMLTPGDERMHIFISSGTGNAPFVSMMKQALADGTPRRAIFLNGVSYAHEIGYRSLLEGWERSGGYPVTYIPTVSRASDPSNASWMGRTGRVETILEPVLDELGLSAANSVAYICGNPDMINAAEQTLLGRGYPENQVHKGCTGRGRSPGFGRRRPRSGDRRERGPVAPTPRPLQGAQASAAGLSAQLRRGLARPALPRTSVIAGLATRTTGGLWSVAGRGDGG
jgi:ferredoxin-NADP reductase